MSQKAVREIDGKRMLSGWLKETDSDIRISSNFVQINEKDISDSSFLSKLLEDHSWLNERKLVVKPDQLIKRRGKSGLILLNASWDQAVDWMKERAGKEIQIESVKGILDTFIVEPFVPHSDQDEYYVAIQSQRDGDLVYFFHEGGVNIGDVDSKAEKLTVEIGESLSRESVNKYLLTKVQQENRKQLLSIFIEKLFQFYSSLNYAYLEINPLVVTEVSDSIPNATVHALDLAAKVDETAAFESGDKWLSFCFGKLDFPPPFGRKQTPEELYIAKLDAKTGASLKLTVLNPEGRVWTMVAGGGASVVYADSICDLGFGDQLANYGEYSGDPNESLTFEYANTILDLMTRKKVPEGKILIIGGGIANFTNVAETFKGIVRSLTKYREKLIEHKVKIFVRRGGPNYHSGLKMMIDCGEKNGIPIEVFGPETHLTSIVPYALGVKPIPQVTDNYQATSKFAFRTSVSNGGSIRASSSKVEEEPSSSLQEEKRNWSTLFDRNTSSIIYGMQPKAVQNMLDFDHVCGRKKPSVVAMIYPFSGNHFQKFYWGSNEILIPVYLSMKEALQKHPEVDVMINFASFRSVFPSVSETLDFPQIRTIAIIAEGVPERKTKLLIKKAKSKDVMLIGPATVGGIKPGCFRIGNTGGMIDNIIASKLYRPGNVAYVSRSGGMSNELNNIISRSTNGVYEGIAIGGDRYPGSTFLDHLLRFEADDEVKLLVLLGEVGGIDEYAICEALETGRLRKPIVAWCMGTCARLFPYEIQFGHAGASARGRVAETAEAKNAALRKAGAVVPASFEDFATCLHEQFERLVREKVLVPRPEPEVPTVPMDYSWAQQLGLIRKPTSFVTSISDERGEELLYSGVPISDVFREELGVGGVLSLLWFRRRLPIYATRFIEMILMLTADHGPAVAGAHNTIVTARAGKDLISSLVSGLMTIGPRFGGATDEAAVQFSSAYDMNLTAQQFVEQMRKENRLIMGIGHRVKSLENPDKRVTILKEYVMSNFPSAEILRYALEVEKVTTAKKNTLILNVDGTIGCAFVDLLRGCGAFTRKEADNFVKYGCLNGLFVLGRSIGLIGHYLDQVRLNQPLYRHPWDDISYISDDFI